MEEVNEFDMKIIDLMTKFNKKQGEIKDITNVLLMLNKLSEGIKIANNISAMIYKNFNANADDISNIPPGYYEWTIELQKKLETMELTRGKITEYALIKQRKDMGDDLYATFIRASFCAFNINEYISATSGVKRAYKINAASLK